MPSNNSKQPLRIGELLRRGRLRRLKTVWAFREDSPPPPKKKEATCLVTELKVDCVLLPGCRDGDGRARNAVGVPS